MDNKIITSNGYKIVNNKLELNFKDDINYFKVISKGVVKAIINDDVNNIIILKNNQEIEISGLLVSRIEFIRDTENCAFAKVKYCVAVK